MKPFQKEFYNLLNLTDLPQGNLQLNRGEGGDCPRGGRGLAQGPIVLGVIVWGANTQGGIAWGAIGMVGNCPGRNSPGG